ncbi:hypothetical protein Goshw_021832, partial [Gossypium schwendimanii]|nr:hypothetical protein [Gossypium schwendimanii]
MGFRLPRIANAKPSLERSLSFLETTLVAKGHFAVYAGEVDEKKVHWQSLVAKKLSLISLAICKVHEKILTNQ